MLNKGQKHVPLVIKHGIIILTYYGAFVILFKPLLLSTTGDRVVDLDRWLEPVWANPMLSKIVLAQGATLIVL